MITKRCFICGSKENGGQCTNPKCPRYQLEVVQNKPDEGEKVVQ